jgi:hypothetical protein
MQRLTSRRNFHDELSQQIHSNGCELSRRRMNVQSFNVYRSITMKRNLKISALTASLAMLCSGIAFAQAPMQQQEPAPTPPPVRAEPAPPPGAQPNVDMTGYLNTEATKDVCKERYPKAADKIESTWKRVSGDAPPAMKAQASSPEYKSALSAKVKELKAGDPAAIKASCENMSK